MPIERSETGVRTLRTLLEPVAAFSGLGGGKRWLSGTTRLRDETLLASSLVPATLEPSLKLPRALSLLFVLWPKAGRGGGKRLSSGTTVWTELIFDIVLVPRLALASSSVDQGSVVSFLGVDGAKADVGAVVLLCSVREEDLSALWLMPTLV